MLNKTLQLIIFILTMFTVGMSAQEPVRAPYDRYFLPAPPMTQDALELEGNEYWTGYWNGEIDSYIHKMGIVDTPSDYAAAICIPPGSAMAEGNTIDGIRFLFNSVEAISNVRVFMSTALPSKAEDADICWQEVSKPNCLKDPINRFNDVRFDKHYKYDPTRPLYVGYSFRVTADLGTYQKFPILIHTEKDMENALLLKFNDGEWKDYYGEGFGILAMQVLMGGDFPDNDVTMSPQLETVTSEKGTTIIPFTVINRGTNGIDSLSVVTEIGGMETEHVIVPESKVVGINTAYDIKLKVDTPDDAGEYNYKVRIAKINGTDVEKNIEGCGRLIVVSRIVPHRVFLEEFTGMNHEYAPLGITSLDELHKMYGSSLVLVSAHDGDAIECDDYKDIINNSVDEFPLAHLDRRIMAVHPYFGSEDKKFGIISDIDFCMGVTPVADISVVPHLDGDIITASTEVTFLYDSDSARYALAYVLTEDCMQDDEWLQANAYSGNSQGLPEEDPVIDPWAKSPTLVAGVIYNQVAIAAIGIENGIPGSIPEKVRKEVTEYHYEEFDLTNRSKIKHRDRLNVAVILFDTTTGRVVNSVSVPLNKEVNSIGVTERDSSAETFYTIDGRKMSTPARGLNIVRTADGTARKVVLR